MVSDGVLLHDLFFLFLTCHLDVLFLGHELDVERARDVECLADGGCYSLNPSDCLHPQLLRREEEGGVSGVHAGVLK